MKIANGSLNFDLKKILCIKGQNCWDQCLHFLLIYERSFPLLNLSWQNLERGPYPSCAPRPFRRLCHEFAYFVALLSRAINITTLLLGENFRPIFDIFSEFFSTLFAQWWSKMHLYFFHIFHALILVLFSPEFVVHQLVGKAIFISNL